MHGSLYSRYDAFGLPGGFSICIVPGVNLPVGSVAVCECDIGLYCWWSVHILACPCLSDTRRPTVAAASGEQGRLPRSRTRVAYDVLWGFRRRH